MAPIDRDALLRTLRAAFLTDLSDHLSALESGLLTLERADEPAQASARVRDLFRSAHGLKGAARAAGLAPIEATCHAMESLLGEARDAGRALTHDDFAALLAGVDALSAAGRALHDAPDAPLEAGALEGARARIEERLGHPPAAPPAAVAPATDPAPRPPAPAAPPPDRPARRASDDAPSRSATAPERTGPRAVRLPPERLEALAATGWDLLLTARAAEQQAGRIDALVQELRRARRRLVEATGGRERARTHEPGRRSVAAERLARVERDALAFRAQLSGDARALAVAAHNLDGEVRALRLVPWSDAAAGLHRATRDLAATLGKEVELEVEGEALEVDHSVVTALREPLAQLARNAVAHGIETPEAREAAGKPRRGRVVLSAAMMGDRVQVRVTDDGRGLDRDEIRSAAHRRGIPVPSTEAELLHVLFAPGFSTSTEVTPIAGRGVGLDIVAETVRSFRGAVRVRSDRGRGATFEIVLPTTLYGLRAVVVRDAGQVLAVPSLDVVRIVRVEQDRIRDAAGRPVLLLDAPLPVAPLAQVLGLTTGPWRIGPRPLALLLAPSITASTLPTVAVLVDEVLSERELVLEPLGATIPGLRFAAGVGLVSKGQLALVVRADEVAAALHGTTAPPRVEAAQAPARRRRILLADDAATTRALERSLLEAAGYDVVAAADGDQALQALSEQGADLVVSDVEMPGRDGFELTRAVRASPRFASLPVILLTGRESEADRARGMDAGADAYLVKSGFDQRQLLSTVTELLEGGHHDPRRDR